MCWQFNTDMYCRPYINTLDTLISLTVQSAHVSNHYVVNNNSNSSNNSVFFYKTFPAEDDTDT